MFKKTFTVVAVAAFAFTAQFAQATTNEAAQTDWSGGPGVPGPVTDWGTTFDTETDINWSDYSGELILDIYVEHIVDGYFDGAYSVYAEDVDDDGDMDVLGAATLAADITWWSNDDGSGTSWTEHTIDGDFFGAVSVYAADVDDDDDMDVLGAAYGACDITWWSNDDGSGTSWTEHTIDGDFNGAWSVYAADVDDDGDMDVLGTAYDDDEITWWENDDGSGTSWTEHTIDGDFDGAATVYAADVDDDGDMDVLGTAYNADDITWWENDDGSGTSWTEHTIDGDFDQAFSVYAADMDDDGDMDVLGTAHLADDITWWSNDDGSGTSWTEHTIDGDFDGAATVYAADVDDDDDMDVLGAAWEADDITWWSNDDGSGTSWTEHTIDGDFDQAVSVYAADVDDDGDMDVLGAASFTDDIAWWEVTGYTNGELVSSIYDTESSPEWGTIDWTADAPEDTTVKFKVRSSSDAGDMGDWSPDITSPGDIGSYLTNGDQYVQYKAILETTDHYVTPALEDITLDWVCTDILLTSFSAESASKGINVSWECTDSVAGFNLYRSTRSESERAITSRDKLNAEIIKGESPYSYLDTRVEEQVTYEYWLEAIEVGGTSETFGPVECTWNGALPTAYALYQSRPNPARGNATIAFDLPEDAEVTLTVYDISGRKVTTVVDEKLTAGEHEAEVSGLTPGVYVYKIEAGGFTAVKKMVVQ